jgi:hypothetical protein
MNDNLTTNASNEAESPAFLVGAVIGSFMPDTIYIIPPYNNHVRFFNVHPNIPKSRAIIEFLKGNDKDPDGDFIVSFQADCKIDGNKLKCVKSDYGQKWETSIDISTIKVDKNFH